MSFTLLFLLWQINRAKQTNTKPNLNQNLDLRQLKTKTQSPRVCKPCMNATSKLNLSSICFYPFLFLFSCHPHKSNNHSLQMAETFSSGDAQCLPIYGGGGTTDSNSPYALLLRLLRSHSPTSSELFSYLGLFVSVGTLLFLLGIAVTATAIGFIVFIPLIIISSPIWLPVFIVVGVFLSVAGFLVGTLALASWTYRYYRGMHPVGSNQMDYARSRIYDTASHVKDYAREYGGYFHGRAKDAAPGAWVLTWTGL